MTILVTGGLGFIGSHACVSLLDAGYDVVIFDNLSNSTIDILDRIEAVAKRRPKFQCGSIQDHAQLQNTFEWCRPTVVVHFAALKAIAESLATPLDYYINNVAGTLTLLDCMKTAGTRSLVFSSTATVYALPSPLPLREDCPRAAANPYSRSKLIVEDILADLAASDASWRIANLRYFNPIGAHESGALGERPKSTPNNLMPYMLQVAAGELPQLNIFGGDYPTHDGSCVRDFVHVADVAEGHVAALRYMDRHCGIASFNLGTGRGVSVFEICDVFERCTGQSLARKVINRRPGDIAEFWADVTRARQELGWEAQRGLDAMCRDAWRWYQLSSQYART